jgi:DivIVA domain-containing protein
MLLPDDIEKKQFTVHRLREGYAQSEVDNFLDEIHASYLAMYTELDRYRKASDAPTQVIPAIKPDLPLEISQASRLLKVAEEAARQEHEEAKSQAARIMLEARDEAKRIVSEGKAEHHRTVGELEERKAQIQGQIDDLARAHADVLRKLRSALSRLEGGE